MAGFYENMVSTTTANPHNAGPTTMECTTSLSGTFCSLRLTLCCVERYAEHCWETRAYLLTIEPQSANLLYNVYGQ